MVYLTSYITTSCLISVAVVMRVNTDLFLKATDFKLCPMQPVIFGAGDIRMIELTAVLICFIQL